MRWLQFVLSHSIFISFCAIGLCYQTFLLLHLPSDNYLYGLVFFATLSSYNFYWLVSKYHFSRDVPLTRFFRKHISNVAIFSLAVTGFICCTFQIPHVIPHLSLAVILTVLYSVPLWPVRQLYFTRKAGFLKTVLLAFTWSYVTVIIPVQQPFPVNTDAVVVLFTARFLFMLMLCIIFDSRDIEVDKLRGLRTLATDVKPKTLQVMMIIVFSLYAGLGFFLRYHYNNPEQLIAFGITGVTTFTVYLLSMRKQGYFFYYFLVDGLMLFSAITCFIASI